MNEIKKEYLEWLSEQMTVAKESNDWKSITTPFRDSFGDEIEFFIKQEDDSYTLSDDGLTLFNLECHGVNLDTKTRQELFQKLLRYFGISENERQLLKKISDSNVSSGIHDFIQGLISIGDLHSISKNKVVNLFQDDVASFLDDNNIRFIKNHKLKGQSGLDHTFDFAIPLDNKRQFFLKLLNDPNSANVRNMCFTASDSGLSDTGGVLTLVNDLDRKMTPANKSALKKYNINTFTWTKKESLVKEIRKAS